MATQTISTVGEIPEFLEKFYVGEGTPGQPSFREGLIDRGFGAIFPEASPVQPLTLNNSSL
jgi:hypothetical protein